MGVPSGAAMSTPWWNEKNPGPSNPPARTPFWNTVRGSPKKPRIGCCLSKGLTGHGYADAPLAAASAATSPSRASPSRKERSMVTPPLGDARRTPRLARTEERRQTRGAGGVEHLVAMKLERARGALGRPAPRRHGED